MVYVDAIFAWPIEHLKGQARRVAQRNKGQWCHMWADAVEELHAMADRIGMRREWFQDKPGFPHYDLVPSKRAKAICLGAMEMDLGEYRERQRGTR